MEAETCGGVSVANSDVDGSWRRVVTVDPSETEEGVYENALMAVGALSEELSDAPDDIEIELRFASDDFDDDRLRKEFNTWLKQELWPWVVMGLDNQGARVTVMLSIGSHHEVTYGV